MGSPPALDEKTVSELDAGGGRAPRRRSRSDSKSIYDLVDAGEGRMAVLDDDVHNRKRIGRGKSPGKMSPAKASPAPSAKQVARVPEKP